MDCNVLNLSLSDFDANGRLLLTKYNITAPIKLANKVIVKKAIDAFPNSPVSWTLITSLNPFLINIPFTYVLNEVYSPPFFPTIVKILLFVY